MRKNKVQEAREAQQEQETPDKRQEEKNNKREEIRYKSADKRPET